MIMKDAVDLEDWKRMEKGLPPRKKPKVKMPEYEPPEVPNQIRLEDVLKEKFVGLAGFRRKVVSNTEGVKFLGYDVSIDVEGKTLNGWMAEKDLRDLIRIYSDKIDTRFKEVI